MNDTELIKSRLDIADIVSEYVELRPAGANFKALCPFHDEKTPSFMVHRGKQIFHCFGCQKSGDIFTFLQVIENLEFPEALKILADKAGVRLPKYNPQQENLKAKIKDLLSAAAGYYERVLWSDVGQRARTYLQEVRGLNEATLKTFELGYAPAGWDNLVNFLIAHKFHHSIIKQSGLVAVKNQGGYYDRFRGRVMFPVANTHGQIVGFSGRLLPELEKDKKSGGKYINTPETPVYRKAELLYGWPLAKDAIKEKNFAVLVEGQMDVLSSYQVGIKNVVAASGTAASLNHFRIIKRLTDKVVFALDNDRAGLLALRQAVRLAWQQELSTYVAELPKDTKDPAELSISQPVIWADLAKPTKYFMDYFLIISCQDKNLDDPTIKKQIASKVLPLIKAIKNPIERSHYINQLSDMLGVEATYIKEALTQIKLSDTTASKPENPASAGERLSTLDTYNEFLLALVIKHPELAQKFLKQTDSSEFTNSKYLDFYNELKNWYNKIDIAADQQPALAFQVSEQQRLVYSILELKAEKQLNDLSQAVAASELEKTLKLRKKLITHQSINRLSIELKRLEMTKASSDKIEQLTKQINILTQQLQDH